VSCILLAQFCRQGCRGSGRLVKVSVTSLQSSHSGPGLLLHGPHRRSRQGCRELCMHSALSSRWRPPSFLVLPCLMDSYPHILASLKWHLIIFIIFISPGGCHELVVLPSTHIKTCRMGVQDCMGENPRGRRGALLRRD
jgi:hypothetical protein